MMNIYPTQESLILVVVMPSVKDMEVARLLGWYRIPLRTAPKVVDVDYLAFYQPKSFGEENRWKIEYFSPVRGHELVTRGELFREQMEHPRANEEYFKIQLGEMIRLPNPISADRWKRITFLYTTGDLFLQAKTINDLVVRSEERQVLWRSLRERALRGNFYEADNLPDEMFDVDEELLQLLLMSADQFEPGKDDSIP